MKKQREWQRPKTFKGSKILTVDFDRIGKLFDGSKKLFDRLLLFSFTTKKFPLNSDFCFFLLDIRFESTMSFQHDQIPSKQAAKAYYDKPGKLASIVASARAGKH